MEQWENISKNLFYIAELNIEGGTGISSDDENGNCDVSITFANSDSNEEVAFANESSNSSGDNNKDAG